MTTQRHSHEPKICPRTRNNGGRVFYIEHCSGGTRKYHRAHPGVCNCKNSTDRRPCQHLLMAQEKMLDYMSRGAMPAAVTSLSVSELFSRYMQEHSMGQLDPKTLALYSYGQKYFLAYMEKTQWTGRSMDLDLKLLTGFKLWLLNVKGYSHCYVNIHLRGLRTVFFWAVHDGYMRVNPLSGTAAPRNAKLIDRMPRNKRERNPLTSQEIQRIETEAIGWRRDMCLLSLYTGMRKGELINLPFAHVTKSCIRITDFDGWHPKQHQRRDIPLHPKVVRIIERLRAENPSATYVFETSAGTRLDGANVQRGFASLFRRLNIVGEDGVGVTIHCFRHTFATKMLQDGVPPTTVRDILGHKDLETTMLYYHRLDRRNAEHICGLNY